MRRTLTFTAVAAGGLVATGAALWALAEHGDGRLEPLLVPTVPADRGNGAPRPVPVPDRAPERSTLMVWLSFDAAAGMVAVAVVGLTVHELSTERVVHSLEDVRTPERQMGALA